jgi:polyphosphate kinase
VYGFVGLKTHCKLALVVREESDGSLRRYCHTGTGNYNPKTARVYEDYGLLTADTELGEDVSALFNHLTGYSRDIEYRRLLVAPGSLRTGLVRRIEHEVANHLDGRPARIRFKCNAIVDEVIIDALYEASQAGVPIDVWVRGICALRPGVSGMSETIQVRSVLGRFLEHSRVFAFENDGEPEVWIGSADLMHRNLDRRVEALVRVADAGHCADVIGRFDLAMDPGTDCWILDQDGNWSRQVGEVHVQTRLLRNRRWRTVDG